MIVTRCDNCGRDKPTLEDGWISGNLSWTTRLVSGTRIQHGPLSVEPRLAFCSFGCLSAWAGAQEAE